MSGPREVVLDTETTGLDPARGHRVIEIGCVELVNHVPTGVTFQRYLNPGMAVPEEAIKVHGITGAMLDAAPAFAEVADAFLTFIADDPLVIHNAEFDLGFINMELARIEREGLDAARAIDTVTMARRRFPGAPASLDALCKRFAIDLGERSQHGALLDARLLALVYLELIGGRQVGLDLAAPSRDGKAGQAREARPPRPFAPSAEEIAAHEAFLDKLTDPVWRH